MCLYNHVSETTTDASNVDCINDPYKSLQDERGSFKSIITSKLLFDVHTWNMFSVISILEKNINKIGTNGFTS